MEFVRGDTLEGLLREQEPFGEQEATLIGLDLCRALAAVTPPTLAGPSS